MSHQWEIVSKRAFDVSREQLWEMYANPDYLAEWRGPKGFRNTFHEFDFSPGGEWRFIMHGPTGIDYPNHSTFREISYPEKIVFDHFTPDYQAQIEFVNKGEKTELIWYMRFQSEALYTNIKKFAVDANEENFDRLEQVIKSVKRS